MSASEPGDPRERLDPRVGTPRREGLTGTAPADAYAPFRDTDDITRAPDGRPMEEQPKWRRDFPIDTPQDQYVARRDFMKFMVLISLAFTAGQFWIGMQNWARRRRGLPPLKKIATARDIPVGGAVTFVYPRETDRCVLIHPEQGVLLAYSQQCTHLSCAVIPQPEHDRLFCPCHEGAFDLRSGRPIAGPPDRPLARIVLDVRGEDIYASGIELRTV
jgi:nitrite reductase/ring-hydroxylating ferredoxin subunit